MLEANQAVGKIAMHKSKSGTPEGWGSFAHHSRNLVRREMLGVGTRSFAAFVSASWSVGQKACLTLHSYGGGGEWEGRMMCCQHMAMVSAPKHVLTVFAKYKSLL